VIETHAKEFKIGVENELRKDQHFRGQWSRIWRQTWWRKVQKNTLFRLPDWPYCHSVSREEFSGMAVKEWGYSGAEVAWYIEVTCSFVTGIVAERQLTQELGSKYENR